MLAGWDMDHSKVDFVEQNLVTETGRAVLNLVLVLNFKISFTTWCNTQNTQLAHSNHALNGVRYR